MGNLVGMGFILPIRPINPISPILHISPISPIGITPFQEFLDGGETVGTAVQGRAAGQQSLGIGFTGVVEYLQGWPLLNDMAAVHHHDIVGNLGDDAQVVGNEDDAGAAFLLQRPQQLEDGLLHGDIESRGWLIGNEDIRLVGQGHGYHHPLLLSAADLVGVAVENLLRTR